MARCMLSLAYKSDLCSQFDQAECKGTHTTCAVQPILSEAENVRLFKN
jgi:hypothetical protein